MKKYIVLIFVGVLLCVPMISKIYGDEDLQRLRWRLDLITYNSESESYWPRLMVSIGPVGIGTAYQCDFGEPFTNDVMGTDFSWFLVNDTSYSINLSKGTPHSYFPLLIRYTPYCRSLGYGDISVYGYFHASLWNREEWLDTPIFYEHVNYDEQMDRYSNMAFVQFNPSFWFKIGFGLSFNPLRFIPFDFCVAYLRTYYPYHRIPAPYREHISCTALSRFYFSFMFSIGYQSAGKQITLFGKKI